MSNHEAMTRIEEPTLPFESIHTENLYPVFQSDPLYGINSQQVLTTTSLNGTADTNDSAFRCQTGTTQYAFATIQSRKRLRYRPGQGVIARFACRFTTPVENSIQVVGVGHSEDGLFVGYNGTRFGILHSSRGVREQRTLTITTGSSTNENVTVTLNGVAFPVAVTNSASTIKTAYEISQGSYTGWNAEANGAVVTFVKQAVGAIAGAFTLTASTAQGTYAQTKVGAGSTDVWYYQDTDWNGENFTSGAGIDRSATIFDPTKLNVFQIGITYLGAGPFYFDMMAEERGSDTHWIRMHTIKNPNTRTNSTLGNPAFPFTMAAYSAGSTTNLTVEVTSFAGFIEGNKKLHGPRMTYAAQTTAADSSTYRAIFTIRNNRSYSGRSNQSVINLLSVSGAAKHTQPVTIFIIKNATLAGTPNFSSYATNSCASIDTAATTITFSTNDQIIWAGQLGETGDLDHHFSNDEVTIQPGETMTLCAKASTGSPSYVLASINTREDQ